MTGADVWPPTTWVAVTRWSPTGTSENVARQAPSSSALTVRVSPVESRTVTSASACATPLAATSAVPAASATVSTSPSSGVAMVRAVPARTVTVWVGLEAVVPPTVWVAVSVGVPTPTPPNVTVQSPSPFAVVVCVLPPSRTVTGASGSAVPETTTSRVASASGTSRTSSASGEVTDTASAASIVIVRWAGTEVRGSDTVPGSVCVTDTGCGPTPRSGNVTDQVPSAAIVSSWSSAPAVDAVTRAPG